MTKIEKKKYSYSDKRVDRNNSKLTRTGLLQFIHIITNTVNRHQLVTIFSAFYQLVMFPNFIMDLATLQTLCIT